MPTPDDMFKCLTEAQLLLNMALRLIEDVQNDVCWVKSKGFDRPEEPEETGPPKKKDLGNQSPYLNTNVRQYAARNPHVPYEAIAARYKISMKKVVELLGTYQTKQEIADAEAKTTN